MVLTLLNKILADILMTDPLKSSWVSMLKQDKLGRLIFNRVEIFGSLNLSNSKWYQLARKTKQSRMYVFGFKS